MEPHSVLIDLRFCLCPGRIEVKLVSRQMFSERFCDLAAARVVNTDKGDFLFYSWVDLRLIAITNQRITYKSTTFHPKMLISSAVFFIKHIKLVVIFIECIII